MGFIHLADRLKFGVTGEDNAINCLFKCVCGAMCRVMCTVCIYIYIILHITANFIPKFSIAVFKMCWW